MNGETVKQADWPDMQLRLSFEDQWLADRGPRPPGDDRDQEVDELNWLVARNTAAKWYLKGWKEARKGNSK